MSKAEDSNETLFYMQDIFSSSDTNLHKILANALLHYAYLPIIVQSLCVLNNKPQLSLNTCLYVLIQTFRIIKNKEFINTLFASLFFSHIPSKLFERMQSIPDSPATYSKDYHYRHLSQYSLVQYIQEYYNLNNLDVFLQHGSQNSKIIQNIKEEYDLMMEAITNNANENN